MIYSIWLNILIVFVTSLIFIRTVPAFAKPAQKMTRKYQDAVGGRHLVECWRGVNCYRVDPIPKFKTRRYIVARPRQGGVEWSKKQK